MAYTPAKENPKRTRQKKKKKKQRRSFSPNRILAGVRSLNIAPDTHINKCALLRNFRATEWTSIHIPKMKHVNTLSTVTVPNISTRDFFSLSYMLPTRKGI